MRGNNIYSVTHSLLTGEPPSGPAVAVGSSTPNGGGKGSAPGDGSSTPDARAPQRVPVRGIVFDPWCMSGVSEASVCEVAKCGLTPRFHYTPLCCQVQHEPIWFSGTNVCSRFVTANVCVCFTQ